MSHSIYWTIFYVSNICVHYFVILPFHTTVFSFQDEVTRKKRKKERETGKQTFHFSASFKSVPTTTLTDLKKMDAPYEDVPLVEFMCLVFTRMPGLFVVLVLRISSGN